MIPLDLHFCNSCYHSHNYGRADSAVSRGEQEAEAWHASCKRPRIMKVPVVLEPSVRTGRVRAYCPDLPGCSAVAGSEPDALALLRRRIEDYFARSPLRAAPGTRTTTVEV